MELEPFGLAEMDVVVAAADSVVNVIVQDPTDPEGVKVPVLSWLATYSVQVPLKAVPLAGRLKAVVKSSLPQVVPRVTHSLLPIPAELKVEGPPEPPLLKTGV